MSTIVSDSHLHTDFSPDSKTPAERTILQAIRLGLKHIAITDHYDARHPDDFVGIADAKRYADTIKALKNKYAKEIYVSVGVELGFTPFTREMGAAFINNPDIEYIINSVHVVTGIDCYNKKFFKDKTKEQSYREYFSAVYESVHAPYRFDAVGHVGYVERVAPYKDARIRYDEFHEYIDRIFDCVIEREKILELNTSTSVRGLPCLPAPELLKVYYDRGGRLITLSSDSHDVKRVAAGLDAAARIARDIGFTYITVKEDGKFRHIDI